MKGSRNVATDEYCATAAAAAAAAVEAKRMGGGKTGRF